MTLPHNDRPLRQRLALRRVHVDLDDLCTALTEIAPNEKIIVLPQQIVVSDFIKRGKYLGIRPTYRTVADYVRTTQPCNIVIDEITAHLEKESNIKHPMPFAGIQYRAPISNNKQPVRLPLTALFEGTRLAMHKGAVTPYDDAQNTAKVGTKCLVEIPSQSKDDKYQAVVTGIPIDDNDKKNLIAWTFATTYVGNLGTPPNIVFDSLQFGTKDAPVDVKYLSAHDVASAFYIMDFYAKQHLPNMVPLKHRLFPLLTPLAVHQYMVLCNNVVVKEGKRHRTLRMSERAGAISMLLRHHGAHEMLLRKKSHGKISNDTWDYHKL